ncbi:hypothetical protein LTR37_003466 [Vermiconidia calcicola]|uniref:Uncharacterized protein n=1 Tax=Vermiconidia calcicola TaxID=1690605 RepID=A0ACC3NS72_9PEZI|nr:hypothetical protein LTR37_003466 [Vermiconidia calcicola]
MLSLSVLQSLRAGDEVFIGVLAAGGYEFTVAMVAALAIGAAVVPMSVANPPEECLYFVTKSKQVAILSSHAASSLARNVVGLLQRQGDHIPHIDVSECLQHGLARLQPTDIVISSDRPLNDSTAGVVIFTSGTTGRPKGSVLRRAYIHEAGLNVADGYDIRPSDVLLHVLPVHHATGLGTSFFPWLISGACIEFRTHGGFDPAWVWDRLRQGGVTVFSGVPTIYMRLVWHYQKEIARLSPADREAYDAGAASLRTLLCGSSALQQAVQDFWTELRNGQSILVRYGSSEVPGLIRVAANADVRTIPKGSVGSPSPGVDVKLSEDGELLIKSPLMFSGYLFDEDATRAAHDADGWFKTGDICRRDGNFVFIIGRASVDIIKSGGYKIGALEIERACLQLEYVREAAVLGVEDEEYGQRVAAIITLARHRQTSSPGGPSKRTLSLDQLRDDLRNVIAAYKLPTLLTVVDGELPKGETGKVQKKILGPQLFPTPGWRNDSNVQVWNHNRDTAKAKI